MDISTAMRTARRLWPAILGLAVVGALLGALVASVTPARFTSTTELYFSYDSPSSATPAELVQANNFALQKVFSYQQVAVSPRVLEPVITSLNMNTTPENLAQDVSASVEEQSVVLSIGATANNPQDAAVLAQAVAQQLTRVVIDELDAPSAGGAAPIRAEVLAPASVGDSNRLTQIVLKAQLGLFAGLVVGLLGAVVVALLDRRLHNRDEVESGLGLPVLGSIPSERRTAEAAIVEGYRVAAGSLLSRTRGADAGPVAVLASTAAEDAGSAAARFAQALAESGTAVVLVDADVTSGSATQQLGLSDREGVAESLAHRAPLKTVVTTVPGLSVVPAGHAGELPGGALPLAVLPELLQPLREQADVVLVVCPPALGGTGVGVAAACGTTAVLVARTGGVQRADLASASGALERAGVDTLGVLLVGVPSRGADSDASTRALHAAHAANRSA
ncbi:Capsular polysaccharide biosynthesis protein [Quadrisphaera granulorum]|uniref:Capsular polysaccharide biosynthesis protein n=1 Tax=Quadrisphaera granulorum TaxID=317664 RepID=A0A315ZUU9_9ACTN|nr:hypothetical protein [Quadrisphaera granulorum]PWJ48638.1 capsular polysaccharide biosynthesis protein [Quadrisphaera granulorum]SZE98360.1 Capsular polysaccharide biosynthesis protein [Quadrisphaera granulorum]